ncbi:heterokaryon incompatibility protein-domain-containing protein, partial [Cadophora sp. MPI-SDFR-AT-0126]
LFREWLGVCEKTHNHPSREATGDIAIRLVDVRRRCLIQWQGPVSLVPRFVALSYVWGKAQQKVLLTTDRLSEFKKPGFFNRQLGQTIHDALEVVARIGETYVWIDAVCILQDSPADKSIQIPQMHQIYGNAVLTIIAAHGDSADAGLPGVGPGSRAGNIFTLELPDIRVLFRSHTKMYVAKNNLDIGFSENYLLSSTYQSRAWTFQEGHLSTRALVFTKDQVYFECERCTWCEETHWESESMDFRGWRAIHDPTPHDVWTDRFDRHAYDLTTEKDTSESLRNSYASLIKAYSQRQLTHDTDILDACSGVLSIIRQREQSDFLFGLRRKYFGNDLLFNILSALPRRFPDQRKGQAGSKARFPSWSWTAWKGLVEIANE